MTWDLRRVEDQIAFLYLDRGLKHKALTLYWGEKWGYGEGFSVSGGIGGAYYCHNEIEARDLGEAMNATERWFYEKIAECLKNCLETAEHYTSILADLSQK